MEEVTATISDGANILAEHVRVWISLSVSPNGLRSWRGHFTPPPGSGFDWMGTRSFQLETEDGRAGQIVVTKVAVSGDGAATVTFSGTGPFK